MRYSLNFTRAAVLSLALVAAPFIALAEGQAVDAATTAKITAELTAQGYDVRKMSSENGMIEVAVVKDGKTMELLLDADLKIVKTCEGENEECESE